MPPPPEAFPGTREVRVPDFGTAVLICLRKAVRARGRATQEEFWYFAVLWLCVGVAAGALGLARGDAGAVLADIVTSVWMLMIVPLVSAGIRRLHDTGRSGGWCWLGLSTVGVVVLLVFWCGAGQPHPNRYGD